MQCLRGATREAPALVPRPSDPSRSFPLDEVLSANRHIRSHGRTLMQMLGSFAEFERRMRGEPRFAADKIRHFHDAAALSAIPVHTRQHVFGRGVEIRFRKELAVCLTQTRGAGWKAIVDEIAKQPMGRAGYVRALLELVVSTNEGRHRAGRASTGSITRQSSLARATSVAWSRAAGIVSNIRSLWLRGHWKTRRRRPSRGGPLVVAFRYYQVPFEYGPMGSLTLIICISGTVPAWRRCVGLR